MLFSSLKNHRCCLIRLFLRLCFPGPTSPAYSPTSPVSCTVSIVQHLFNCFSISSHFHHHIPNIIGIFAHKSCESIILCCNPVAQFFVLAKFCNSRLYSKAYSPTSPVSLKNFNKFTELHWISNDVVLLDPMPRL